MTSQEILKLLAIRHRRDIFLAEVKNGPTMGPGGKQLVRMDAWAMTRSWTHFIVRGYEIKVNRGDFLRDDKWMNYLPLCNEFYFIAPPDIIKSDELPKEAGLMLAGKSIRTIKKASRRTDVVIPESLYRYILMFRVNPLDNRKRMDTTGNITGEMRGANRREFWQNWLKEGILSKKIGQRVAYRKEQEYRRVMSENKQLKRKTEQLEIFKKQLEAIGINVYDLVGYNREKNMQIVNSMGMQFLTIDHQLQQLMRALEETRKLLKEKTIGRRQE